MSRSVVVWFGAERSDACIVGVCDVVCGVLWVCAMWSVVFCGSVRCSLDGCCVCPRQATRVCAMWSVWV